MPSGWGHQGFTMVSEGLNVLVLWDVYLFKNDLLVAGFEGFLKESHEMFFKYCMFWAVKRYDYGSSFFVTKGVPVISVSTM